MKILRVADVPNNRTGGMSRTMYCTGDYMTQEGHIVDYLFREDFKSTVSGTLRTIQVNLEIPKMIQEKAQAGIHYDIVEIHEPIAAGYCWAKQFDRTLPPVALFSYGIERRSQMAELSYHRQKNLPISLALRSVRVTVLLSNYALRKCDRIVCSNSEDIQYLISRGISGDKLTLHQSGVDQEFLEVSDRDIQSHLQQSLGQDIKILFFGSWIVRKGILDVVKSMTDVLNRFPNIQFTVAGCGYSREVILASFDVALHAQIQVIPGIQGNDALIEVYQDHSILLLPSFFEGQPLVLMEASAMGLVTVTTPICGMQDFIEPNQNGLTVPVGDDSALTDAIVQLIENPKFRIDLGKHVRHKVNAYTWRNASKNLENSYQRTTSNSPKNSIFKFSKR